MKYLLFGDIHGTRLNGIDSVIQDESPEVIICTGDFDQPQIVREYMDLEQKYLAKGKQVITVPGNHDVCVYVPMPLQSGTLRQQGKTVYGLHEELQKDEEAKSYLHNLLFGKPAPEENNRARFFLDEQRFGKTFPTMVIHGALRGDWFSFPSCPPEIKDLWLRLLSEFDYEANFKAMKKEGVNIMLRGHDHRPTYVSMNREGDMVHDFLTKLHPRKTLYSTKSYVITPGAYFDGFYAIVDTAIKGQKRPVVRYCQLK